MEENKDLIYYLKKFNRKERYFLVREALGNKDFKLGNEFRDKLQNVLNIEIPENAYAAMDYHLDWIDVSLKLWHNIINIEDKIENDLNEKGIRQLNSNQEDIDFIIAFKQKEQYMLILIEAKAETSWTNSQMDSKVKRLKKIFGEACDNFRNLQLHFILMSPKESDKLSVGKWPDWMRNNNRAYWMKLETEKSLLKITRCKQNGDPSKDAEFYKIEEITHEY